jgi:hypothetical protein
LLVAPLVHLWTHDKAFAWRTRESQASHQIAVHMPGDPLPPRKSLVAALADRKDAKLITHVQVCLALSG